MILEESTMIEENHDSSFDGHDIIMIIYELMMYILLQYKFLSSYSVTLDFFHSLKRNVKKFLNMINDVIRSLLLY